MERWERRERKKRAEVERMPKTGMSVRLIAQILAQRAAEAKAKHESDSDRRPNQAPSRRRKRRH